MERFSMLVKPLRKISVKKNWLTTLLNTKIPRNDAIYMLETFHQTQVKMISEIYSLVMEKLSP
jgi:hypothetical protein